MGKKFAELRNKMSPEAQKEVELKVEAATNNLNKPPKTILENFKPPQVSAIQK